jgi:hypothetical protein
MINIQPYIDKLEMLKEFIAWKVDTPDKILSVIPTTDAMVAFQHSLYAVCITRTFEEHIKFQQQ